MGNMVRYLGVAVLIASVAGCGGGGGSRPVAAAAVTGPAAPTTDLKAKPTAAFDLSTANAQAATANTLAAAATEAVNSMIKVGPMYGILSMTNPWPINQGSNQCITGSVSATMQQFVGAQGAATYSACVADVSVGPVDGVIYLSYTAWNSAATPGTDFIATILGTDLQVASGSGTSQNYAPAYMATPGSQIAHLVFRGQYTLNLNSTPPLHSPVYAVDTGNATLGSQTIIGQPLVTNLSGGLYTVSNPSVTSGFSPATVLVRSNIDAAGNWVEMTFNNWNVDTSNPVQSRPVPSRICSPASPCMLTINDKNGNTAVVTVTDGALAQQQMVFTPKGSAPLAPVPVSF